MIMIIISNIQIQKTQRNCHDQEHSKAKMKYQTIKTIVKKK